MAGNGIDRAIVIIFADARPQGLGPGQGADAAGQADDRSAGEVMEAQGCQPAAAPGPVPDDGIDEQTDEDRNQTG